MSITFRDSKARDEAIAYLTPRHRDLVISSQSGNQLRAVMTDARLSEAREYAVQQNINILRNRVNQLGVAEPVVQRRAQTVLWLSCRVSRIPLARKKFSARPRRWNSVW